MNRRPSGLKASQALIGFLQYKSAEGLAPTTMVGYEHDLKSWIEYVGDMDVAEVRSGHILSSLSYLRTDYVPHRLAGDNSQKLTPQDCLQHLLQPGLILPMGQSRVRSGESAQVHPAATSATDPPVEPFKKEDVELLIKACDFCGEAVTDQRRTFIMQRPTGKRDKAILLTLLDTGLRASELCALRIADVDLKSGRVEVRPGQAGKAKGGKGRIVFLGKSARRFLWRYLTEREDMEDPEAPLFLGKQHRVLNSNGLRQLVNGLGQKAGVRKCHPHRFRHTFAITYLRSGGDVFTLKSLLGHGSLDMVEHYARIAEVDVEQAHRKASPADNWRL